MKREWLKLVKKERNVEREEKKSGVTGSSKRHGRGEYLWEKQKRIKQCESGTLDGASHSFSVNVMMNGFMLLQDVAVDFWAIDQLDFSLESINFGRGGHVRWGRRKCLGKSCKMCHRLFPTHFFCSAVSPQPLLDHFWPLNPHLLDLILNGFLYLPFMSLSLSISLLVHPQIY